MNYLRIKEYACDDRPREKLLKHGSQFLSNAELLALVIGSGIANMNAVDLAKKVLKEYNNNLGTLQKCSIDDLQNFKGIGPAKATMIASVLELHRRFQKNSKEDTQEIKEASDAYLLMKGYLSHNTTEECWIILLNRASRVLKIIQVSKGGLTRTTIDPAVILKKVLVYNATSFILVHNHPSGDSAPSTADIKITNRLQKAAQYVGVNLLDHIIVTDEAYFSFGDEGLMSA